MKRPTAPSGVFVHPNLSVFIHDSLSLFLSFFSFFSFSYYPDLSAFIRGSLSFSFFFFLFLPLLIRVYLRSSVALSSLSSLSPPLIRIYLRLSVALSLLFLAESIRVHHVANHCRGLRMSSLCVILSQPDSRRCLLTLKGHIMNTSLKSPQAFIEACKKVKLLLFDYDGVLTDGRIVLGSNGSEMKFFSTVDGLGIKLWHEAGLLAGSITGRSSEALEKRASELKFDELHQNIARKGVILAEIMARRNLQADEIAYIGADINDLPVRTRVGLFFAPANHHPSIRPYTDYILDAEGGHGVIREVVDIILAHKGVMQELIKKYIES